VDVNESHVLEDYLHTFNKQLERQSEQAQAQQLAEESIGLGEKVIPIT